MNSIIDQRAGVIEQSVSVSLLGFPYPYDNRVAG
jgi:hypothetical protein